ncbi:uncharacterized protein PAE49_024383 isoform 2-T2 [Odontesthes bonariensis]|uniref:uncharacterized protein LOC142373415 isoform X2 n=1 Tax=Odontesthes bonariensis TaxID=219752 RepID=UPI003F58710C
MFRRSRFSVRPNVSTAGRTTAATPQETPPAKQEASETPKEADESVNAATVTSKTDVTPSERAPASGEGNDQNGEGTSSSAALQRRKRFSIKPKVAPGRPPTLSRTPKSPIKAVITTTAEVSGADSDKPSTSSQAGTTAVPHGLQSPRRRRHSEDSKQHKTQPKLPHESSENSGSSIVETAEKSPEQTPLPADSSKQAENISSSQVKEGPPRPPDKVPPSLPDKEATEISEKAKTLVSSKNVVSLTPSALSLSRLLNSPSDLQRLVKAQKLRELLRQERCKEKKLKKTKSRSKEFTLDPTKMMMRDLIHYLPTSNPMTSCLEDLAQENETVVPPSPAREESPEQAQEPEVCPTKVSSREEEAQEEEEAAAEEEEDEDALMVPQVRVAEDGSLIIDEESLTVEVLRAKGPNPAQGRDPIFERGSTTTYSSFRKGSYTKPWSIEETDMFFLAVSMVGTDFSMICQLFPQRARSEIKNKFKKEERENSWRIDKAFRERRKLDIEYFSKLLERVLEVQKTKKKLKSLDKKNTTKTKAKGKRSSKNLSDVEEKDENHVPDLKEGEKENEDQCNEGEGPAPEPKRKRKRKNKPDALTEEPSDKKNKTDSKNNEQTEADLPEDSEAALPEGHPNSDKSEEAQNVNAAKGSAVKPAKLSRGRAPKPPLPLGLKRGKKSLPSTKAKETVSDKEDESVNDGVAKEQKQKDEPPLSQAKPACDDISSGEEDVPVKPQKPTRYGRVPKPTQPLNYPSKEDTHSTASETTPSSPSASKSKTKSTGKRGKSSEPQSAQKSKKPKLVTLRSSKSDFSDEEDEDKQAEDPLTYSSYKDCDSSLFVPASLHSSNHEISEVDESMVEQAQHETGTTEPCEHQLDLLVDVIDFLSSEHTEVSQDQSYNEAAETLLTIGNLTHISQSAQNETTTQDSSTGTTSAGVNEPSRLEQEIVSAAPEQSAIPSVSAAFCQPAMETSKVVGSVELQANITDSGGMPHAKTSDSDCDELKTVCNLEPTAQLQSNPENTNKKSPLTKTGRFTKAKPKPNLGRTSRTVQSISQTEISKESKAEESHTVVPNVSQVNETAAASKEKNTKMSDSAPVLFKDDVATTEVKQSEEPSDSKKFVDQEKSEAAASDHGSLVIQSGCFSESHSEPSRDQGTRDSKSSSDSPDETLSPDVRTPETFSTSGSTVTEVVTDSYSGSAPVQDKHLPSLAEDLPVSQKEESEVATPFQPRSRLPKVKPKPNLSQALKIARSKPQTTEETAVEDSHPTEFHKTIIAEADLQSTSTLCPILNPTEEQPAKKERNAYVGPVDPALDAASSNRTVTERQNISESQLQPSMDTGSTSAFKDENLTSHVGTAESSCKNVLTDSAVTQPEVRQGSSVESAAAQEGSVSPAVIITPVEKLTVTEEKTKVASACQLRRSRLQKIKPKPNLPQTSKAVKSRPQTTNEEIEEDSSPNPEFLEKTIAELEPQLTCTPCPEKQSEQTDPALGFKPSLTADSTFTATEELPLKEESKTYTGLFGQMDMEAATSDLSATEHQNLTEVQLEPSKEHAARETGSTDESVIRHVGTSESSCNNVVLESQVGQTSNLDSAPGRGESDQPAKIVKPVELPVREGDGAVASTCQFRRSRLQKIKPKPNLPQISRAARSKPQTPEEPVEKEPGPSPSPELHKETTVDVEPQPKCGSSPDKHSENFDPALVFKPTLTAGYTVTPTEEEKTYAGVVCQIDMDAATSGQSVSENLNFSEVQLGNVSTNKVSPSDITDENLTPHDGITKSSGDRAVAEEQVGLGLNVESATAQEGSGNPASIVKPVQQLQVSREDFRGASACQLRRSQLQKRKPKPNLPQTSRAARPKCQTPKEPLEKDSSLNPDPEFDKKTVAGLEPQHNPLPEIQSQKTDVGLVGKVDLVALTSDQDASESQNFSEVQPEFTGERSNTEITSEFPDENLTSHVGAESSFNNAGTANSTVSESQVGHVSNVDLAPVKEGNDHPATFVNDMDQLSVSSKPELTKDPVALMQLEDTPQSSASSTESPDNTVEEVETQPTCSTTPPEKSSQAKDSDGASDPGPLLELASTHTCLEEFSLTEEQPKTNVGCELVLSSDCVEQNVPLRRQRFPKVKPKPNLGRSSRIALRKPKSDDGSKPSEDQHMETSSSVTSEQQCGDDKSGTNVSVETRSDGEMMSENLPAETDYASQWDCKVDLSATTTATVSNNQQITDLTAASDVLASTQDGPTQTETHCETSDASPICPMYSPVQSTDHTPDSQKTSEKAPQVRRGRLVKPKPNLRCSNRLQQLLQVQNTTPTGADSGGCSQVGEASVGDRSVSEPRPDHQEPIKRLIDKPSDTYSSSTNAQTSLGCVTQLSPSQNAPVSSTEGIQSYPLLSEILPEQVPLDPDEPFFILSLTEIPVSSAGEVVTSGAEHLSYLPVTDASMQRPGVSGESLAAGGGSMSYVAVPASTNESSVMGLMTVKDVAPEPAASEGNTTVQPATLSETLDSNDTGRKDKLQVKSKTKRKKQTAPADIETGAVPSRASTTQDSDQHEPAVQPKDLDGRTRPKDTLTGGKKPHSRLGLKTSQNGGRSLRSRNAKDIPSYLSETKNTSPASDPPPSKAPSKKSKKKTPFKAGKRSSPEPAASASHDITSTQSVTQPTKEAQSKSLTSPVPLEVDISPTSECLDPTPSTSQCTAEASASQEDDCAESFFEEEPTNVSQYFLSDIFTDVDEE